MGNKVIQKICTILNEHIEQQYIYRISGDEFVMIWPDVDYKVFMSAAKKLEAALFAEKTLHRLVLYGEKKKIRVLPFARQRKQCRQQRISSMPQMPN